MGGFPREIAPWVKKNALRRKGHFQSGPHPPIFNLSPQGEYGDKQLSE
jgi:hypothetical protein